MNVCTPGRALHLPGSSFHVHDDFTDYSDACVGCACDDNGDDDADDDADDDDDNDDDGDGDGDGCLLYTSPSPRD